MLYPIFKYFIILLGRCYVCVHKYNNTISYVRCERTNLETNDVQQTLTAHFGIRIGPYKKKKKFT